MARIASIVIALAVCARTFGVILPISTQTVVPEQMLTARVDNVITPITMFLPMETRGFTAICWVRFPPTNAYMPHIAMPSFSVYPARATKEGGRQSDFPTPVLPYTQIELDANAQWVMPTDLPAITDPHYAASRSFANGCYSVNIFTPCVATLTIAGTEWTFQPSNAVQCIEIPAKDASRSVALSAADPQAVIYLGIRENVPRQFFQTGSKVVSISDLSAASLVSNEWAMVVLSAHIVSGTMAVTNEFFVYTQDSQRSYVPDVFTQTVPRATFAQDARISFFFARYETAGDNADLYGWKIYPRFLTVEQIEHIRDLDAAEMRRRGMSRWRTQ